MVDVLSKKARERAKELAEQRRAERRLRKRKCVLCGVEESDKTPFVAHPDGIGPACRDEAGCAGGRTPRPRPLRPFDLFDETLRDGTQSPSVSDPPIEQKLALLDLMEAVGIR